VDWTVAGEFILGGLAGGIAGMLLATRLSAYKDMLNRIFADVIFVSRPMYFTGAA